MSRNSSLKSIFFLGLLVTAVIAGVLYFTDYSIPFLDNRDFYVESARENISGENLNFTRFESGPNNNYVYFDNRSAQLEVRLNDEGKILSKEARYSPADRTNEYILTQEQAVAAAREFLPGSSWELIESKRQAGNYILQLTQDNTYSRLWVDASEGNIVYYYRDFQSGDSENEDEPYTDEDGRVED